MAMPRKRVFHADPSENFADIVRAVFVADEIQGIFFRFHVPEIAVCFRRSVIGKIYVEMVFIEAVFRENVIEIRHGDMHTSHIGSCRIALVSGNRLVFCDHIVYRGIVQPLREIIGSFRRIVNTAVGIEHINIAQPLFALFHRNRIVAISRNRTAGKQTIFGIEILPYLPRSALRRFVIVIAEYGRIKNLSCFEERNQFFRHFAVIIELAVDDIARKQDKIGLRFFDRLFQLGVHGKISVRPKQLQAAVYFSAASYLTHIRYRKSAIL